MSRYKAYQEYKDFRQDMVNDACTIPDSNSAHQNQMLQLLSDPQKAVSFARVVFDLLVSGRSNPAG